MDESQIKTIIENAAREYLATVVYSRVQSIISSIREEVADATRIAMMKSEHYESLINGALRIEFGLEFPALQVGSVIDSVCNSISVTVNRDGDRVVLQVGVFRSDLSDALSASGAYYVSTSKTRTSRISWLDWLLTKGDSIIITDAEIKRAGETRVVNFSGSRTGKAIMVHRSYNGVQGKYNRSKGRSGPSQWGVPAEFAGVAEDNWFDKIVPTLQPIVEDIVARNIKTIAEK